MLLDICHYWLETEPTVLSQIAVTALQTCSRWQYAPLKLICHPAMNAEFRGEDAAVMLSASDCCT